MHSRAGPSKTSTMEAYCLYTAKISEERQRSAEGKPQPKRASKPQRRRRKKIVSSRYLVQFLSYVQPYPNEQNSNLNIKAIVTLKALSFFDIQL